MSYPIDIYDAIVFSVGMKDIMHDNEHLLNPPPKKYRVSFKAKAGFLFVCLFGVIFYFYMIIERRHAQSEFLLENQMAAVKLVASKVPLTVMQDPITKKDFTLSDFKGSWVLLNLWATWCPPCQQEMPSLELLQKKMGDKLVVIALSADDKSDVVSDYINLNHPSFRVLFDVNKALTTTLGIEKFPETFLVSPEGELVAQFSGPREWISEAALSYFKRFVPVD